VQERVSEGAEPAVESAITAGPDSVTVVAAHEDLFDFDSEHTMERTDEARGLVSIPGLRGHAASVDICALSERISSRLRHPGTMLGGWTCL
jgi:hypothetical protein